MLQLVLSTWPLNPHVPWAPRQASHPQASEQALPSLCSLLGPRRRRACRPRAPMAFSTPSTVQFACCGVSFSPQLAQGLHFHLCTPSMAQGWTQSGGSGKPQHWNLELMSHKCLFGLFVFTQTTVQLCLLPPEHFVRRWTYESDHFDFDLSSTSY